MEGLYGDGASQFNQDELRAVQVPWAARIEALAGGEEATEDAPERVGVVYLLKELARVSKTDFERWALVHWGATVRHYEGTRHMFRAMERLGLSDTLEAHYASLEAWGAQVREAQVLALADAEEPALDYTDPIVLKYLGLWMWLCDHAPDEEGATQPEKPAMDVTDWPLDWAKYFEPDLLNLPAFGCDQVTTAHLGKKQLWRAHLAARHWLRQECLPSEMPGAFADLAAFARKKKS